MVDTFKDGLNRGNQNDLGALAQGVHLGNALGQAARTVSVAVASDAATLPDNAKALALIEVFATAGTTPGRKTIVAAETAPSAGEAAVGPTGDVLFNAADAVTAAVITYTSVEGAVISEQIQVAAAGTGTLLQSRQAQKLLSASLDAGTVAGTKAIIARGDAAPATGQARLNLDGVTVEFLAADVGASPVTATITYLAVPGTGGTLSSVSDALGSQFTTS
jgi:hypothetical protein